MGSQHASAAAQWRPTQGNQLGRRSSPYRIVLDAAAARS